MKGLLANRPPCWILALLFLSVTVARAGETPEQIIEKMQNAYLELSTYRGAGKIVTRVTCQGEKQSSESDFSLLFSRPGSIRYEKASGGEKGALVIGTPEETTIHWKDAGEYTREKALEMSITDAVTIVGGAPDTVLSMLLGYSTAPWDSGLKLLPEEKAGETPCYVIAGEREQAVEYTLWIGKTDHLLRKYVSTTLVDREMMQRIIDSASKDELKATVSQLSGFTTVSEEIHQNIKANPQIPAASFTFSPPAKAEKIENFK